MFFKFRDEDSLDMVCKISIRGSILLLVLSFILSYIHIMLSIVVLVGAVTLFCCFVVVLHVDSFREWLLPGSATLLAGILLIIGILWDTIL